MIPLLYVSTSSSRLDSISEADCSIVFLPHRPSCTSDPAFAPRPSTLIRYRLDYSSPHLDLRLTLIPVAIYPNYSVRPVARCERARQRAIAMLSNAGATEVPMTTDPVLRGRRVWRCTPHFPRSSCPTSLLRFSLAQTAHWLPDLGANCLALHGRRGRSSLLIARSGLSKNPGQGSQTVRRGAWLPVGVGIGDTGAKLSLAPRAQRCHAVPPFLQRSQEHFV